MKKFTTKTIEDENPHFILEVIAETVAEQAVGASMRDRLSQWENLNKEQKTSLDNEFKAEVNGLAKYFVERANTHYQYNTSFNKSVKAKGNKGRDFLYMFMYHWSGGDNEGKTIVFKKPGNYKQSIINWKREQAAFNAKHTAGE